MDKQDIALRIYTGGIIAKYASALHRVDQATPYEVLERIVQSDILSPSDILVDYGCGRGRVCFYLADKIGCRCVGIERAEPIFDRALKNLEAYGGDKNKVSFVCSEAEEFDPAMLDSKPTAFYLFNPFSGPIFEKVYYRVRKYASESETDRAVKLILYHPDVWTMEFMRNEGKIKLIKDIDMRTDRFDYPFKKVYVWDIYGKEVN